MTTLIETPYGRKSPELLCSAMDAYTVLPDIKQALEQIAAQLATHPDIEKGNSRVHFCYHKAVAAFNAANKVEILP